MAAVVDTRRYFCLQIKIKFYLLEILPPQIPSCLCSSVKLNDDVKAFVIRKEGIW